MALKYSNARLLVRFISPAALNPFDTEFASALGIKFNPASWVKFRKNHVMKLTWQPIFKCSKPINSALWHIA